MANDKSEVELLVSGLSLEQVKLYHLFHKTRSLKAVAAVVHLSPNTVRDRMNAASNLFLQVFGHELLLRSGGRYELTNQGEKLASAYPGVTEWIAALIDEHRSIRHIYDVPCTSNALKDFATLRAALPANRDFDLRPKPVRTSELQIYGEELANRARVTRRYAFAFGSILVDHEQIKDGLDKPLRIFNNVDVIARRVEPLFLLGSDQIQVVEPVDVQTLLYNNVIILMPEGGVVWRFLQEIADGWQLRKPSQWIEIPHLEYGIKMLANRLVDRAAMVVHGDRKSFESSVPATQTWRLKGRNEKQEHRALTGLVVDHAAVCAGEHRDLVVEAALRTLRPIVVGQVEKAA